MTTLHKMAEHLDGRQNERRVIATVGDTAYMDHEGTREAWKLTNNVGHYVLVVDGKTYEYAANEREVEFEGYRGSKAAELLVNEIKRLEAE